jgi:hypothetical protein
VPAEAGARWRPNHVVLMHGFLGFRRLGPLAYFSGVEQALEAEGFRTHAPTVNPLQLSAYRAYQWFYGRPAGVRPLDQARRLYAGPVRPERVQRSGQHASIAEIFLATRRPVLLIAHSQGCRDARYLLSERGMGAWRPFDSAGFSPGLREVRIRDCVAALCTIAGAHNGMQYAEDEQASNWILRLMADRQFNRFVSFLSQERSLGEQAVREHGRSEMLAFNRQHPDPPGVALYSVAGLTDRDQCTFFLKRFYDTLRNDPRFEREENDGLVNLSSAQWPVRDPASLAELAAPAGRGLLNDCFRPAARRGAWQFLGTVYADHVEQIGLPFAYPSNPFFDHLAFYRGLVHKLAGDFEPQIHLQRDGTWSARAPC